MADRTVSIELTGDSRALQRALQQAGQALDRFAAQGVKRAFDSMITFEKVTESLSNTLTRVARSIPQAFARIGQAAATMAQSVVRAAGNVRGAFQGALATLDHLHNAIGLVKDAMTALANNPMVALAKAGVDMNVTLARATAALTKITGSAAGAQRFIAELRQEAATSALTFKEMLPVANQLAAAYGPGGLGKVLPTMRAFGDTAATLGVSAEGMQLALLGFRQLLGRDFAQQEELNQITENLPGLDVKGILKKQFGTADTEELKDANVTGQQVGAAIVAGMQQAFGGAQAAGAKTLPIIISNFQDAFESLAASVTAQFTPQIEAALFKILKAFESLATNQKFIDQLKLGFTALGNVIAWLADHAAGFVDWLTQIANAQATKEFLSSIIGLLKVIGETLLGSVLPGFQKAFDPKTVKEIFPTILRGIAWVVDKVFALGRVWQEVVKIVAAAFADLGDWIGDKVQDINLSFHAFFAETQLGFQQLAVGFMATVLSMAQAWNAFVGPLFPQWQVQTQALEGALRNARVAAAAAMESVAGIAAEGTRLAGARAAREARKDAADPDRHKGAGQRIADAYFGRRPGDQAAQDKFWQDVRNAAAQAELFLFGPRPGYGPAAPPALAPPTGIPVGSMGSRVNPRPPAPPVGYLGAPAGFPGAPNYAWPTTPATGTFGTARPMDVPWWWSGQEAPTPTGAPAFGAGVSGNKFLTINIAGMSPAQIMEVIRKTLDTELFDEFSGVPAGG